MRGASRISHTPILIPLPGSGLVGGWRWVGGPTGGRGGWAWNGAIHEFSINQKWMFGGCAGRARGARPTSPDEDGGGGGGGDFDDDGEVVVGNGGGGAAARQQPPRPPPRRAAAAVARHLPWKRERAGFAQSGLSTMHV